MLQQNARVTKLTGSGVDSDWDRPAAAAATKWQGDTPAYYREKSQRVFAEGTTDVVVTRTVYLPALHAIASLVDGDDSLTVVTDDGRTITGRVLASRVTRPVDGVPADVVTCRIDLENA